MNDDSLISGVSSSNSNPPNFCLGLEEVERECQGHNIQFYVLLGDPSKVLVQFVSEYKIAIIVLDFSPLKEDLDTLQRSVTYPFDTLLNNSNHVQ